MRFLGMLFVLVLATNALADITADTGQGKTSSQDRAMSIKKSIENKVSTTASRGREVTSSSSTRQSGSIGGDNGLDLTIPTRALFPDEVEYRLPADFGLAAEVRGGWINTTEQQFYEAASKSGARIGTISDETALREYIRDIARFAARCGQAQITLNNWVSKIGTLKKSKNGSYEVTGLGADDLITLATGAWLQADKQITDRRIRRDLDTILTDRTPCRLDGSTEKVACGSIVIHLNAPPSLRFREVEWFGGAFAGINGSYKVSSSWSWQKSLENGTGSSSFAKKAADEMESRGDAFDATMTRKQAVERSRGNKASTGTQKVQGN